MNYLRILLIIIIFLFGHTLQSQNCLPAGIVFETQADIDQFATNYPGCTSIDGDVCIGQCVNMTPTDITNLDGLLQLTSIHGNVDIIGNPLLADLNGLQNLTVIDGNFAMKDNPLTDLSELNALSTIGGNLTIDHSGKPESMPSLLRVGGDYTSITDSSKYIGNNTLKYIGGDVNISSPFADTISGFETIDTIFGKINISGMNKLKAINIAHHIKYLSSYYIANNFILGEINDLNELSYLGDLNILNNESLFILPDFQSLPVVDGDFIIKDNSIISTLHGFESIKRINGSFFFNGITFIEDIQDGTNQQRGSDGIYAFHNLTYVGGDFILPLSDFYYPIDGFTKLDSIGHNLQLNFENDEHHFPQFNHFKFIGGDIKLENIDSLKDLQCFNELNQIFGALTLFNCNNLKTLSGLEKIKAIGGSLSLRLFYLNNISSLSHLQSIGGGLEIYGSHLVELTGLDSVRSMHGPLSISFNYDLESLSGIAGIDPSGFINGGSLYSIIIAYNFKLSFCRTQNICDALRINHSSHYVMQNAEGCNGPEQILCSEYSLTGTVFLDENQDKIQDPTEHGIPGIKIHVYPEDIIIMTDENGSYAVLSEENAAHTITLEPDIQWMLTTDSSQYTRLFQTGLLSNANNDFGLISVTPFFNGSVSLTSDQVRCHRAVSYFLKGTNESSAMHSGRVVLTYSPGVTYSEADVVPDTIDALLNRLVWNLNSFSPFEFLKSKIIFNMPDETHVGETFHFAASIYLDSSGVEKLKDVVQYDPVLVCSHDPNDKMVMPSGVRGQNYTRKDDYLNYTIRFENTGNIDAIDVTVIDTLDASLDMNTFKVLSTSHPVVTSIVDHIVQFNLPNIWLAPMENGLISYEIKPRADAPVLTSIENNADIIFETNQPVVTNTTQNTLVDALCVDANISEQRTICKGENYLGHTEAGIYIDTTHIGIYCDSIHELDLIVRETEFILIDTLICEGENFNGYDTAGIYTYDIIDSLTGCTDSVQLTLGIIPMGEGICLSGIENEDSNEMIIYPNPATDEIYIDAMNSIGMILLTTIDGQKILFNENKINSTHTKIILNENLSGGLYLITIVSGGHRFYRKIIIL